MLFDKDYALSRDGDGSQMFSLGGYYSECKYDEQRGKWILARDPETTDIGSVDLGRESDGGGERGGGVTGDVLQRDGARNEAKNGHRLKGGRRFPMGSACTCPACLALSRWKPENGALRLDGFDGGGRGGEGGGKERGGKERETIREHQKGGGGRGERSFINNPEESEGR